jgi:hypothetical protein
VPPEHRRSAGGFDRMVAHLIAPAQGAGGGLGGWALGSLAPSYAPDQIKQAKRSLLNPQGQPPPLTSSPRSGATATKAVNSLGGVWDRAVHYVLYGRCRQGRCLASHQGLWRLFLVSDTEQIHISAMLRRPAQGVEVFSARRRSDRRSDSRRSKSVPPWSTNVMASANA